MWILCVHEAGKNHHKHFGFQRVRQQGFPPAAHVAVFKIGGHGIQVLVVAFYAIVHK